MFQQTKKYKTPEEELREVEISNVPNEEFKAIIIKLLNEFERKMDENRENFNQELENIKKNQTGLKNKITETICK